MRAAKNTTGSRAAAHPNAPAASMASPARYTRRLPKLSPKTPAARRPAASPTGMELSSQARATASAPRSAAVPGRVAIGVT
ncbi:MAG: hypothetical protein JWR34_2218 [Mycobacterium sp.]|nr:hypothetical protein [Mycobacterium sp.]